MDLQLILTLVTCASSLITLGLVAVAVLPHVKQGAVIIRDAILWITLIFVMSFVMWVGWQRVAQRRDGSWQGATSAQDAGVEPAALWQVDAGQATGDRYYAGPRDEP